MHPTILALQMKVLGQMIMDIVRGDPVGDRRQRTIDGCARCYVLVTDRPLANRRMLWDLTDPPTDRYGWRWPYNQRVSENRYIRDAAGRKVVLARISQGGLGIENRLGVWNGAFWAGLRTSGAIRRGPGTEWRIWERQHRELVADLSEMPLMHRLEPRPAKHGQRRLRRCYASLLPPEKTTERSLLAGLFAGAAVSGIQGEQWFELPDSADARAVLVDWGIPFGPHERPRHRMVLWVSPMYGALVAHLMPPRSAARMLAVRKAGGCPFLPAVLWQMAMTAKGRRYMPFPDALPYGTSRATFFRRRWRRKELNRIGWLDLGIRITPKLRELMVEWHDRRAQERAALRSSPGSGDCTGAKLLQAAPDTA